MFNERNQAFKTEFMMIQSCERRKDAMLYKNINRKFLSFNLENHEQMIEVGITMKPFGFFQHIQHKAVKSRIELLRIWAETQIAKRAARYIRNLYRENPEKFFDLHFNKEGSPVAEICQCKYILSDNTSQKMVSLADERALPDEMAQVRKALLAKEQVLAEEQKLAEEFSPMDEAEGLLPKFGLQPAKA